MNVHLGRRRLGPLWGYLASWGFTVGAGEGAPPRLVPVAGVALCALLAATLPLTSVLAGLEVFAVGLAVWLVRHRAAR